MKLKVYSIFDTAAQAFTQPFFMHNDGLAIRAFQDNVNAKEPNNISQHPDQFALYLLGDFDDSTGDIDKLEQPRRIALGIEMKNPTEEDKTSILIEKMSNLELIMAHINIDQYLDKVEENK